MKRLITALATLCLAGVVAAPTAAATQVETASDCWRVYQYRVTAETLTLRNFIGGEPNGVVLTRNDLFNVHNEGDVWVGGFGFTPDGVVLKGTGWALKSYLAYTGNNWCK